MKTCLLLACALCVGSRAWSASDAATEFVGRQIGGTLPLRGGTTGWEFTTLTDLIVDRLGIYDDHLTGGLAQAHTVGLWRADGTPLAEVQIPAGEAQPLEGNFRYIGLPSTVRLSAFATYVIASSYASGGDDRVNQSSTPIFSPHIRFEALREGGIGFFHFPTGRDPASGPNIGPNFTFIPEPAPAGDIALASRYVGGSSGIVQEPLEFIVTVTNRGGIASSNIRVRIANTAPANLPFESFLCSPGTCQISEGALLWNVGTLGDQGTAQLTFSTVAQTTGAVVYESELHGDTPDPFFGNNAVTNAFPIYAPSLELSAVPVVFEGAPLTARATLTPALSRPVSIEVTTQDGTALAGVDYVAMNTTLTFAPGETVKLIEVSTVEDSVLEPDESVTIKAIIPWIVNPQLGTVRIVDNDWRPGPYEDDFEGRSLSSNYWIPAGPPPLLVVSSDVAAPSGQSVLYLAPGALGSPGGPVSATLRLNAEGLTNRTLSFSARYGPGSPQAFGLGSIGINVTTDEINSGPVPGTFAGLKTTFSRFVYDLEPILAQLPANESGFVGITFFNRPIYYPPMFGQIGYAYDMSLVLDDVQLTGCPIDGAGLLRGALTSDGNFKIQFPTCQGVSYSLEFKSDLQDAQWNFLETISGDGQLKSTIVPRAEGDDTHRFFRIRSP